MRNASCIWLVVLAVLLVGCDQLSIAITDPVFAEFRMTLKEQTDVELLVFVKARSDRGCKAAIGELLVDAGLDEDWEATGSACKKKIRKRDLCTFENKPIHATYMRVDREGGWSHDTRMIIFGVPSTRAAGFCEETAAYFRSRLGAEVGCIQRSVG